jgi:phosphate butyryltransferase
MNIAPTVEELSTIALNALELAWRAGIDNPTAALLSSQTESLEIPQAEAVGLELSQRFMQERFPYIFEGSLALDDMFYLDSLPDVILVPHIEAGNLLGKSMMYFHGMKSAGLIAGATAPVIMLSRADDAETKMNSIAMACQIASGRNNK